MTQQQTTIPTTEAPRKDTRRELYHQLLGVRRFLRKAFETLSETLEPVAKPLFAINRFSSLIRSLIFFAALILWIGYAYIQTAPNMAPDIGPRGGDIAAQMLYQLRFMVALMIELARPLFVPAVFRKVLVIAFAFWLAYRIAAIYLADIFELSDIAVASKFIRQAAFYTVNWRKFNWLVIRDGRVAPEFEDSPIVQIGGPGLVTVQLENVAVFEKVDGEPHIIRPSRWPVQIEGFERLRKIIDLRDQFIEGEEVAGRTKDGIRVKAKGVRFNFSIKRNTGVVQEDEELSLDDTRLPQPLSFTDEAILNIVYNKPDRLFPDLATGDVKAEIYRFIARNTLNEFFADSRKETGQPEGQPSDPTIPLSLAPQEFKARDSINHAVIDFFRQSPTPTIDLHWLSVGTWEPPAEIQKKMMGAWETAVKSQMDSNEKALTKHFRITRLNELLRLVQDVPINAFGHIARREPNPEVIKRQLMLAYREKIKNAYDLRKKAGWTPSANLIATLKHLQRL